MSEQTTEEKEWSVDWEVKVLVSLTKTITLSGMEIIDAESAKAAVQKVKDELEAGADIRDLDISGQIEDSDFEIDGVEMETFKLTDEVTLWAM